MRDVGFIWFIGGLGLHCSGSTLGFPGKYHLLGLGLRVCDLVFRVMGLKG